MKKLLSLLLAGTMLFSLAACRDDAEEKDDSKKNKFDAVEDNGDFGGENDGFNNEEETSVQIGDYITFGKYEQDNDTSNGKEDIEWLVLDKEGDRVFVISKYALDCKPYNVEKADVTWETCTLRIWLNDEFFNEAFTSSEMSQIPTVTVTAGANPRYNTNPGNDTQDKIFLLSIDEANEYFDSDAERECQYTDYVMAQGARVKYDNCFWWLRSPGYYQNDAAYVYSNGRIYSYIDSNGYSVVYSSHSVRPAMWIEL